MTNEEREAVIFRRRERAKELIDALNAEAGPGRVLSGAAQVLIFALANDVPPADDPMMPFYAGMDPSCAPPQLGDVRVVITSAGAAGAPLDVVAASLVPIKRLERLELLERVARCARHLTTCAAEFGADADAACAETVEYLVDAVVKLHQHDCSHSCGTNPGGFCALCGLKMPVVAP